MPFLNLEVTLCSFVGKKSGNVLLILGKVSMTCFASYTQHRKAETRYIIFHVVIVK